MASLYPAFMGGSGESVTVVYELAAFRSAEIEQETRVVAIEDQEDSMSGSSQDGFVVGRVFTVGSQERTVTMLSQSRSVAIESQSRTVSA